MTGLQNEVERAVVGELLHGAALAVIGDRWTLLILRDAFLRVRRFEDFQSRLGIARRVLTERLAGLVADGVLKKVAYQKRPTRHEYRLIQKGFDLYPVVLTLVHWGDARCWRGRAAGRPPAQGLDSVAQKRMLALLG